MAPGDRWWLDKDGREGVKSFVVCSLVCDGSLQLFAFVGAWALAMSYYIDWLVLLSNIHTGARLRIGQWRMLIRFTSGMTTTLTFWSARGRGRICIACRYKSLPRNVTAHCQIYVTQYQMH